MRSQALLVHKAGTRAAYRASETDHVNKGAGLLLYRHPGSAIEVLSVMPRSFVAQYGAASWSISKALIAGVEPAVQPRPVLARFLTR